MINWTVKMGNRIWDPLFLYKRTLKMYIVVIGISGFTPFLCFQVVDKLPILYHIGMLLYDKRLKFSLHPYDVS